MHSETSQVGVEPKQELGGPRSAEREGGGGAFPAGGQRRLEPQNHRPKEKMPGSHAEEDRQQEQWGMDANVNFLGSPKPRNPEAV